MKVRKIFTKKTVELKIWDIELEPFDKARELYNALSYLPDNAELADAVGFNLTFKHEQTVYDELGDEE